MDKQSVTYRDASEADWAGVDLDECVVYTSDDENVEPIKSAEYYDTSGWDNDRLPIKTMIEARSILAARIADPDAPETSDDEDAYDDPEQMRDFADDVPTIVNVGADGEIEYRQKFESTVDGD